MAAESILNTPDDSCLSLDLSSPGVRDDIQASNSSIDSEAERGTRIDFKRLDKICDPTSRSWELYDTILGAHTHGQKKPSESRYVKYADYALIVRRKVLLNGRGDPTYITKVFVWSRWLRSVLKEVLKDVQSVSWTAFDQPLKLDPQILLAFLPCLKAYLNQIYPTGNDVVIDSDETALTSQHIRLLIGYLESDYAPTLQKIAKLLSDRQITYDLLWAIYLPGSTILATCPVTSERRAYRLRSMQKVFTYQSSHWRLRCEYVEIYHADSNEKGFGWASCDLNIQSFEGKVAIDKLSAYPIDWDPQPENVKVSLVSRGQKWASIPQHHHAQYNGLGYYLGTFSSIKYNVQGRIMVDRASYAYNHTIPEVYRTTLVPLSDVDSCGQSHGFDPLLYASPVLYGFDLIDKRWLKFNIQSISEIKWNDNMFKNLNIEQKTKTVLQGLIEVQAQDRPFDDFVEGKGLGLVINLFGPPGVGKSFTVEAMSEHLRQPLYIIGAGDLGTDAATVDGQLKRILSLVPKWNAILLIDEADVFLEKRRTDNLERNAIVAVFLREIEYFRGILFLTTNREKEFDHAFQSRIHLSLRYPDLDLQTRTQLWTAFLSKARENPYGSQISSKEMNQLAKRNLNGRQIKNVVKVATSLARSERMPLVYEHLVRTLDLGDNECRAHKNYFVDLASKYFTRLAFGIAVILPLITFWISSFMSYA